MGKKVSNIVTCIIIFIAILTIQFVRIDIVSARVHSGGGWRSSSGITIGLFPAYVASGKMGNAFAAGVDLSYFHKIHAPVYFWISPGAKIYTKTDDTGLIPYVEAGLSALMLSVGAGYGRGFLSSNIPVNSINIFAAINIPIWVPKKGRLLYGSVYYRPVFAIKQEDFPVSHETGIMIKWLFEIKR
jgi:hypothetical protein